MLYGHFQHFRQLRMPVQWASQRARNSLIQLVLQSFGIEIHFVALRPIRRLVCRQAAADRIDAKRKKLIEERMKRLQAKGALPEQIPIESFDVSDIKNDAMPLGDRPVI